MKKSTWLPITLFFGGCAFYVYNGITWNAWMENLPNIIIYAVILLALRWALKKKDELSNKEY